MTQIPVRDRIEERMEVVGSCGEKVGDVDGLHHYIPVSWVVGVDDKVHLDKDVRECQSGWRPDAASCGD